MVMCGPNGGHGCAGTANHRRLQLGSWLASSQRSQGGVRGGGHAPARQGAPTAAIAASPARNHHSRHLRHTAVSGAYAGKHAHTWGWGWGNAAVGGKQGAHGRRGGSKRGKGERQKLHNCNTCRARSKETLKWAPWRRHMRSAPWLRTPWPARVGYRNHNKIQRSH